MNADLLKAEQAAEKAYVEYLRLVNEYEAARKRWYVAVDAYDMLRDSLIEDATGRNARDPYPAFLNAQGRHFA